jgi:hypothetical protein
LRKLFLALGLFTSFTFAHSAFAYDIQKTAGKLQITLDPQDSATASKPIDLLFVVDNSGSMEPYQKNLASYAHLFATQLSDIDLHAGVTTTGGGPSNTGFAPVGPINWVSNQDPQWVDQFKKNVMVGTNGDVEEKPFDSIALAFKGNLNQNAAFFRQDADLVIVLLTDADDQSKITPDELESALVTFKGQKEKIGFHGLIAPESLSEEARNKCRITEYPGPRNEGFIARFNGIAVSLCDETTFQSGIQDIIKDISDRGHSGSIMGKVFTLPMKPDLQTMEVTYGSPLVRGDVEYGWIYLPSTQEIKFGSLLEWKSQPAGTPLVIKYVPTDWQK